MSHEEIIATGIALEKQGQTLEALQYYVSQKDYHPAIVLRMAYVAQRLRQRSVAFQMHALAALNKANLTYQECSHLSRLPPKTILIAGYDGWFPFDVLNLSQALQKSDCRFIETMINIEPLVLDDLTPASAADYKHRAVSLIEIARYEACILLEVTHPSEIDPHKPEHWSVLENVMLRAAGLIDYYSIFYRFYQPQCVIYPQGYMLAAAVMRVMAQQQNIPCLALENTCDKDRLLVESKTGISVTYNSVGATYEERRDAISDETATAFWQDYFGTIKSRKQGEHTTPDKALAMNVRGPDQKMIAHMGQVGTDSSVLFGSPYFTSQAALIVQAAQHVLAQGHYFVVKLHPKEKAGAAAVQDKPYNQLTLRKIQAEPGFAAIENNPLLIIDADNEFDSYNLVDQADACLTVNSQIGLEAACMGKPVVVCGKAVYGPYGFTQPVQTPDDLFAVLDAVLAGKPPATAPLEAQKFFYSYLYNSAISKTEDALVSVIKTAGRL